MKIVHIVATPSGAPWMIALAREQKKLGHDVEVIVPSLDGDIAAKLEGSGIAVHAAPVNLLAAGGALRSVRDLFTLVRLLRRLRPDVVHSHIVPSVITARIASWIADVPAHFAGNVHPLSLESELYRALEIGTAFCDTKTIASCNYTRELYVQYGVPAEQVELVYYAVDQNLHEPSRVDGASVRRDLGLPADAPVVGKIAYFYPPAQNDRAFPPILRGRGIKGHDVLVRAVPHVLERVPDAKFVLVGRGWGTGGVEYERTIQDLARSLGVADAVLFPGERHDVANVLAAFDVSVHCSLSDNLAGTVESLLLGRPMVVSDTRGFADTVLHEETGLVVPKDDPRALADAIVRLLQDRDLARRLGQNGRKRMLGGFTLAHTVAGIERLLAGTKARAVDHYRFQATIGRLVAAPFRLFPVLLRARRVLRS